MRLHKEVVEKREKMVKEFFASNPHAGIQRAQEFLQKKGERSMNTKSLYKIREQVRKTILRREREIAKAGETASTTPMVVESRGGVINGQPGSEGLPSPVVNTLKTLAGLMRGAHIENVSLDLSSGRPLVRFVTLTPREAQVEIAAENTH